MKKKHRTKSPRARDLANSSSSCGNFPVPIDAQSDATQEMIKIYLNTYNNNIPLFCDRIKSFVSKSISAEEELNGGGGEEQTFANFVNLENKNLPFSVEEKFAIECLAYCACIFVSSSYMNTCATVGYMNNMKSVIAGCNDQISPIVARAYVAAELMCQLNTNQQSRAQYLPQSETILQGLTEKEKMEEKNFSGILISLVYSWGELVSEVPTIQADSLNAAAAEVLENAKGLHSRPSWTLRVASTSISASRHGIGKVAIANVNEERSPKSSAPSSPMTEKAGKKPKSSAPSSPMTEKAEKEESKLKLSTFELGFHRSTLDLQALGMTNNTYNTNNEYIVVEKKNPLLTSPIPAEVGMDEVGVLNDNNNSNNNSDSAPSSGTRNRASIMHSLAYTGLDQPISLDKDKDKSKNKDKPPIKKENGNVAIPITDTNTKYTQNKGMGKDKSSKCLADYQNHQNKPYGGVPGGSPSLLALEHLEPSHKRPLSELQKISYYANFKQMYWFRRQQMSTLLAAEAGHDGPIGPDCGTEKSNPHMPKCFQRDHERDYVTDLGRANILIVQAQSDFMLLDDIKIEVQDPSSSSSSSSTLQSSSSPNSTFVGENAYGSDDGYTDNSSSRKNSGRSSPLSMTLLPNNKSKDETYNNKDPIIMSANSRRMLSTALQSIGVADENGNKNKHEPEEQFGSRSRSRRLSADAAESAIESLLPAYSNTNKSKGLDDHDIVGGGSGGDNGDNNGLYMFNDGIADVPAPVPATVVKDPLSYTYLRYSATMHHYFSTLEKHVYHSQSQSQLTADSNSEVVAANDNDNDNKNSNCDNDIDACSNTSNTNSKTTMMEKEKAKAKTKKQEVHSTIEGGRAARAYAAYSALESVRLEFYDIASFLMDHPELVSSPQARYVAYQVDHMLQALMKQQQQQLKLHSQVVQQEQSSMNLGEGIVSIQEDSTGPNMASAIRSAVNFISPLREIMRRRADDVTAFVRALPLQDQNNSHNWGVNTAAQLKQSQPSRNGRPVRKIQANRLYQDSVDDIQSMHGGQDQPQMSNNGIIPVNINMGMQGKQQGNSRKNKRDGDRNRDRDRGRLSDNSATNQQIYEQELEQEYQHQQREGELALPVSPIGDRDPTGSDINTHTHNRPRLHSGDRGGFSWGIGEGDYRYDVGIVEDYGLDFTLDYSSLSVVNGGIAGNANPNASANVIDRKRGVVEQTTTTLTAPNGFVAAMLQQQQSSETGSQNPTQTQTQVQTTQVQSIQPTQSAPSASASRGLPRGQGMTRVNSASGLEVELQAYAKGFNVQALRHYDPQQPLLSGSQFEGSSYTSANNNNNNNNKNSNNNNNNAGTTTMTVNPRDMNAVKSYYMSDTHSSSEDRESNHGGGSSTDNMTEASISSHENRMASEYHKTQVQQQQQHQQQQQQQQQQQYGEMKRNRSLRSLQYVAAETSSASIWEHWDPAVDAWDWIEGLPAGQGQGLGQGQGQLTHEKERDFHKGDQKELSPTHTRMRDRAVMQSHEKDANNVSTDGAVMF